jgi:glutamate synthase (ferredoxin)
LNEAWNALPEAAGLYDPRHESDACGTGFVADLHGPSARVLAIALASLGCMDHRGGVGADGQSGDGAGILTQIPYAILGETLLDPSLARPGEFAVAMVFLPKDPDARQTILGVIEAELARERVPLLAWRDVPTDNRVLGEDALASRPIVRQALLGRPTKMPAWAEAGPEPFERLLYIVRRRIERRVLRDALGPMHIASMSSKTICYKGLLLSSDLSAFYPDLLDPRYVTSIAVFHQRFSTNTFPTWSLAQPFRFLGHNGEINTLEGNRRWQRARDWAHEDAGWGEAWKDIVGLLPADGSDSACLDTMLELLTLSGEGLLHAMRTLVPPAFWVRDFSDELGAFFRYHEARMEPWDGPSALVMTDGRLAAACLDRNGLRPLRWLRTASGLVVAASEAGIVRLDADSVVERGRLGPGGMLAVDTLTGRVLDEAAIHEVLAAQHPWVGWVAHQEPAGGDPLGLDGGEEAPALRGDLLPHQKQFGFGKEDIERVLLTMSTAGHGPVGSMGDDTPVAVLSKQPQTLYRYIKQRFSQVTNPAMDPLRETGVMSLDTLVGARPRMLQTHGPTSLLRYRSPLLSPAQLGWLRGHLPDVTLSTLLQRGDDLDVRLEQLAAQAVAAVNAGAQLLVLSDEAADESLAPLPMLLAVSAVHEALVDEGLRHEASLVCASGEPIEDHHFACLIGFGADLVLPWLGWPSAVAAAPDLEPALAAKNYRNAIETGLRKIMAKLGISCVQSYRGARLFEVLGLGRALCERWLPGAPSRVGGAGPEKILRDLWRMHDDAWGNPAPIEEQGRYRWRQKGEHHALSPHAARALHQAVRGQDAVAWRKYLDLVEGGAPTTLRDLLAWKPGPKPVPLDEVEPASSILRRFCTGAMSMGSLSREAHQALAVAMNRVGGKSNSGEGGEDALRFLPFEAAGDAPGTAWRPQPGDNANSAIKQVASARFGVTAPYLVAAEQIEIKMAQGSKPGEGGQIPGEKVTAEIAHLRRSVPGVSLISPPPHHDIYSIEDLAQLIFDLKRVNERAPVGVKLVARSGVGTIAAGVVKAGADVIQISGCDGGTGASPLASVKHVGLPWELGLAETHQVLMRNKLRGRVVLRADGGLRSGRDVVLAALLGAEEFGFGTVALIAVGCVMARQCHLNTCPVGVATQDETLRGRFPGTPEHVIAWLVFAAEQVRHALAEMGFRSLAEAVGRVDRLKVRPEAALYGLDLSPLLVDLGGSDDPRHHIGPARNTPRRLGLDEEIGQAVAASLAADVSFSGSWRATNRDRTLGARAAGLIARRRGEAGMSDGTVRLRFTGTVGQSFGAFCMPGMELVLRGEAQDYVGKSMSGGLVVVRSDTDEPDPVLAGNTLLYGATGGELHVAGRVGERLAVRNSGARTVVEGCGDHGCEYMTSGEVIVLGPVGWNFGAGMSGGVAWLWDPHGRAVKALHSGVKAVAGDAVGLAHLKARIELHSERTGSAVARRLLADWNPKEFVRVTA